MRDSPSLVVINLLLPAGELIQPHEPVAEDKAHHELALDLADAPALLEELQFVAKEAVQGVDALITVTECKAYRSPNWPALKTSIKSTAIFDGRSLYEPRQIKSQGIEYHGIGRVEFNLNQRECW
jgi:UDPglucose 6-dehydrogenase